MHWVWKKLYKSIDGNMKGIKSEVEEVELGVEQTRKNKSICYPEIMEENQMETWMEECIWEDFSSLLTCSDEEISGRYA